MSARLLLVVAILSTIGCDRVTKHFAAETMAGAATRSYLADTVRLGYVENPGGFLGVGATLPPAARVGVFTIGTGVMLLVVVVAALRAGWQGLPLFGVAFLVAGGLSNWADRLVRGTVVDFLNVGIGPVRTGVFNVADVAVMFGAILIVVSQIRSDDHR